MEVEGNRGMMIVLIVGIVVLMGLCVYLDVTRRRIQKQLNCLVPLIQVVDNMRDILYYCEIYPVMKYRYLSQAINHIIGPNAWNEHLANPNLIFDMVHPEDYDTLKKKKHGQLDYCKPISLRLKNNEGHYIWFEEYATPIYENGRIVAIQGIFRNIETTMELHKKLEYKATHDRLTAIYNHDYFEMQFEYYDQQMNAPIAIIICDLDNLKKMNDSCGHRVGDVFIQESARLLTSVVDDEGSVSRIGGDEFAIVLTDITQAQVDELLARIHIAIREFNAAAGNFKISMSIGQAYRGSSLQQMDQLFIEADNDMYKHKNEKKAKERISSCN